LEKNQRGGTTLYGAREVFDYWYRLKDLLKWKIVDIRQQRTELSESRQSGMETSYGMTNASDILLQSHGIYVKRQNGDKITAPFVNQIAESYDSVQAVYGGLRKFTTAQPLIVSHSAETYMYASKAIGVFIAAWGSIGVSNKYGPSQFSDTFAHELAHFIDHKLGARNGRRYLSDDYSSIAGRIARAFRATMNESTDSEYLNSSKECFARALQMHYGITTRGEDAEGVYDLAPPNEMVRYVISKAFISLKAYKEHVLPLIKELFETYADSFMEPPVKTAPSTPDPIAIRARAAATALRLKLKLMQMKY
jgi:hypothetical protein